MGNSMKKHAALAAVIVAVICACDLNRERVISGKTMGTTYTVKVISGIFRKITPVETGIRKRLEEINRSMSTFIEESEISRFNRLQDTETDFAVSDDFWKVMREARKIYDLTRGAWDGTVNPLVNLWGFGARVKKKEIPAREEIEAIRKEIGFKYIEIGAENPVLRKRKASISLDLSSIAKGYAVDQVAELIRGHGFRRFLVEIGGEVYASGLRKDGTDWRIGINTPVPGAGADRIYAAVALRDQAMATSGNYRNFFYENGKLYSHIIDPRTGFPVENAVVSATVIAETCTFADGLATALMVMEPERGVALVDRLNSVECLIISRSGDRWVDHASAGFLPIE